MLFCTPVLVPHIVADHRGGKRGLFTSIVFSLGRLIAYLAYALALGVAGEALSEGIRSSTSPVLIGMGALLIIYGVSISYGHYIWPNVTSRICAHFRSRNSTFVLGVLMGLTPCLPLTMAMAYSLTLPDLLATVAFFIFFWLGSSTYTVALGAASGAIGQLAVARMQIERIRRTSGIALFAAGVLFFSEGFNFIS
jgi:cytochrome c biogenesis protein CcdA